MARPCKVPIARAQPRLGKPTSATDLQTAYLGLNTQFDKFGEAVIRLGGIVGHPQDNRRRVSIDAVEDAAQHADFIESLAGLQHIWAHQTDLDGIHMRPHLKNTRRNRPDENPPTLATIGTGLTVRCFSRSTA
jgi:hypothetical protein